MLITYWFGVFMVSGPGAYSNFLPVTDTLARIWPNYHESDKQDVCRAMVSTVQPNFPIDVPFHSLLELHPEHLGKTLLRYFVRHTDYCQLSITRSILVRELDPLVNMPKYYNSSCLLICDHILVHV